MIIRSLSPTYPPPLDPLSCTPPPTNPHKDIMWSDKPASSSAKKEKHMYVAGKSQQGNHSEASLLQTPFGTCTQPKMSLLQEVCSFLGCSQLKGFHYKGVCRQIWNALIQPKHRCVHSLQSKLDKLRCLRPHVMWSPSPVPYRIRCGNIVIIMCTCYCTNTVNVEHMQVVGEY